MRTYSTTLAYGGKKFYYLNGCTLKMVSERADVLQNYNFDLLVSFTWR